MRQQHVEQVGRNAQQVVRQERQQFGLVGGKVVFEVLDQRQHITHLLEPLAADQVAGEVVDMRLKQRQRLGNHGLGHGVQRRPAPRRPGGRSRCRRAAPPGSHRRCPATRHRSARWRATRLGSPAPRRNGPVTVCGSMSSRVRSSPKALKSAASGEFGLPRLQAIEHIQHAEIALQPHAGIGRHR